MNPLTPPTPPFDPDRLVRLTLPQLRQLHGDLFGQQSHASDSHHLLRKIAWELQARAAGGLPESVRQRALTIARHSTLRTRPIRPGSRMDRRELPAVPAAPHDPRLPRPGSCLVRTFRDRQVVVKVLASGFEFDGRHFPSLSSIARQVTGTRWNGFVFFGLLRPHHHAIKNR